MFYPTLMHINIDEEIYMYIAYVSRRVSIRDAVKLTPNCALFMVHNEREK